jgi:hypothetical protein
MFDPVDCLGQDLLDYLTDLEFDCEFVSEYLGDKDIDVTILEDDGHPDHKETFEEWYEGCRLCIHMYNGKEEITFNWGTAEIVSHSISSEKVLKNVQDFIENYGEIQYVRIPDNSDNDVSNPADETEVPSLEATEFDSDGKLRENIQKYFADNPVTIQDILRKINDSLQEEMRRKLGEE